MAEKCQNHLQTFRFKYKNANADIFHRISSFGRFRTNVGVIFEPKQPLRKKV